MTEARYVITAGDETGPAVASAKRNLDLLTNSSQMSAKAITAAMRQVPAQMTDIVVSLQSGQKPLTVLLQQGGQLKDVFGGVAPAAKAVGAYVFGLVTPLTLAASAATLLAVAWHQGAEESRELNKAVSLTGGYAGLSASQLMGMAAAMAQVTGTRSQAVATLAELTATGKISGDVLQQVGLAVQATMKATDEPMKAVIQRFVQLADEPVKASADLNRQYHYLTQSVFEQIRALDEQGKRQEAVTLAQRTFAEASKATSLKVTENLGFLETAWNGVKSTAAKAWDAMLGVGRAKTGSEELEALQKQMTTREAWAKAHPDQVDASWDMGNKRLQARIDYIQRLNGVLVDNAKKTGDNARAQQEAVDATESVAKLQDQAKGRAAVNRELEKYRANLERIRVVNPGSELLLPKNVAAGEKAIRATFAGSGDDQALDAKLRAIKGAMDENDRALKRGLDGAKNAYDVGLIDTRDYLDREFQLRQDALQRDLELARQQEVLARGKKNVAAAEQYKADVRKIQDEITANAEKHANELASNAAKIARGVALYRASLLDALKVRGQAIDDDFAGANLGPRAREDLARLTAVQRDVAKRQDELRKDLEKGESHGGIGREQYDKELAALQDYHDRRLEQERNYNARSQALRVDWKNGADRAIAEYLEGVQDAAGMSAKAFTNAFQGMEDGLVKFAQTGKLDFRSMADSIIADLIRIQVRQSIMGPLVGSMGGGGMGLLLGTAKGALGAMASGGGVGGTYGPDNIDVGGGWSPAWHTGGIVGDRAPMSRFVHPSVFDHAAKYHSGGIAGDEVAAILKKGEGVFTAEQMAAMGTGQQQVVHITQNLTVGDVASMAQVRAELAASNRALANGVRRSQVYGG